MNADNSGKLYCYNHPNRETHLRCNKCERPICSSCAVLTPTGYRCKECVRGQQKIFDTARWWDYPVTLVVAFVISLVGSAVVDLFLLRITIFAILVAPLLGMGIVESVRFVVRRRRSKKLFVLATAATFLGGILAEIPLLLPVVAQFARVQAGGLLSLFWPVLFAVLTSTTVYYRLKGIRI